MSIAVIVCGACLACEAVVSKEHRDAHLSSFNALYQDLRPLDAQERGEGRWVRFYAQLCSPRPRKRGTLHGWALKLTRTDDAIACEDGTDSLALDTRRRLP